MNLKLFCFVDTHGNEKLLDLIGKRVKHNSYDLLICAGDFTLFERNMKNIIKKINAFNLKTLIITGNHETPEDLKTLIEKQRLKNILFIDHGLYIIPIPNKEKMTLYSFIGYGGAGFSKTEASFNNFVKNVENYINKYITNLKKDYNKIDIKRILILHAPPYGTTLDLINHNHLGVKEFREYIIRYTPELVVCGHFHENFGKKDKIGKSLIINPGPDGMVINI